MGFIRSRQAPDDTRRLLNILSAFELSKIPALFLLLDAEKAFDRIHWGFTFQTLSKFGFQGSILTVIKALYTTPSARVLANGMLSEPFSISNGTRQGCPLSPLIFTMVIEPLAEAIRMNHSIKVVNVAGTQYEINLFTDDVMLTLTDSETSLSAASSILNAFGEVSYYKVNSSKSLLLCFFINPSLKSKLQSTYPYVWKNTSIPYLGIHLTKSLLVENYFPALQNYPVRTR